MACIYIIQSDLFYINDSYIDHMKLYWDEEVATNGNLHNLAFSHPELGCNQHVQPM